MALKTSGSSFFGFFQTSFDVAKVDWNRPFLPSSVADRLLSVTNLLKTVAFVSTTVTDKLKSVAVVSTTVAEKLKTVAIVSTTVMEKLKSVAIVSTTVAEKLKSVAIVSTIVTEKLKSLYKKRQFKPIKLNFLTLTIKDGGHQGFAMN